MTSKVTVADVSNINLATCHSDSPNYDIWRKRGTQCFTLKFTVNFKEVDQIPKFFTNKRGLGPGYGEPPLGFVPVIHQ
jgi:hypothetical protein